jgi:steroid delta-isomerase
MASANGRRLADFFEHLRADTLDALAQVYAPGARFIDPFNDVRGPEAIARIFADMFAQLEAPRFQVADCVGDEQAVVLVWVMVWGPQGTAGRIEGCSHVHFDADGRVSEHRDYWDPARALYESVPLLGRVLRCVRRRLSVA